MITVCKNGHSNWGVRSCGKKRFCITCKQNWEHANRRTGGLVGRPKRTSSQENMTGLENRAEYFTPTLQVQVKPTLDVLLASGARYRVYPCVTEGV